MMILILHILVAIGGIISATLALLQPSQFKISTSYVYAACTLASGLVLTAINPTHLATACLSGLAYFSFVGIMIYSAQKKFASSKI